MNYATRIVHDWLKLSDFTLGDDVRWYVDCCLFGPVFEKSAAAGLEGALLSLVLSEVEWDELGKLFGEKPALPGGRRYVGLKMESVI